MSCIMKKLLIFSLISSCLGQIYVQNLPTGTVVFGTEGQFLTIESQPRDCVLAWKERSMLPKTFVYNSKKKTCTPLTSVLGTKKAVDGEEAYLIETSEDICQRNVTKAVEDITEKTTTAIDTTTTSTTTTTTTTTTEAPWSQEVVLIREPEGMVHYERETAVKEGSCSVNSYERTKELLHSNTHYVSCGKCADKIKLDTSPPRDPCLPRIEDVEKSKPIGVCDVDQKEVVNKLQIDYLLPMAATISEYKDIRCLYPQGAVFYYYNAGLDRISDSTLLMDGGCVETKNGKFYTAKGFFDIFHYCGKDGNCTVIANRGTLTPVNGGKSYTKEGQRIGRNEKPFDDKDAYLKSKIPLGENVRRRKSSRLVCFTGQYQCIGTFEAFDFIVCTVALRTLRRLRSMRSSSLTRKDPKFDRLVS
uniref:Uncharacterized protein n=1 Tax=Steinernema glaseri TaxID=37863 RepID=A0A1I7XXQ4_9BILA